MTTAHKLGKQGEKIACDYLKTGGFLILDKNWHSGKYGEIDVVAQDNLTKEIVFVEVKTRDTSTEDAKELLTSKKQQQIYKLAQSYLFLKKLEDYACRFDVIAIKINEMEKELEHIRNAFYL
jgi:putative endonuclease